MFCVPYRYNKILDIKTVVKGKQDKRPFLINARYLDLKIDYDHSKWPMLLYKKNKIRGVKAGKGLIFLTSFDDAVEIAKKNLIINPYFFLKKKPKFIKGKIPYDGITESRDINIKKITNGKQSIRAKKLLTFLYGQ